MEFSLFECRDVRDVLRREYLARRERNPKYSLRAFARDVKLSASFLSDLFNGRTTLSARSAATVAHALGYTAVEQKMFFALVDAGAARSETVRHAAAERAARCRAEYGRQSVNVDQFDVISDWYHFAILELIAVAGGDLTRRQIARRLRIGEIEANGAIERLKRLGLLAEKAGVLVPLVEQTETKSGEIPSKAINRAHRQLMTKAMAALEATPLGEREYGAHILAVDSTRLPEAKALIRDFLRSFNRLMDAAPAKDRVYCLSLQLFGLDHQEPTLDA